jgi:hypothetical protein
MPSEGFEFRSPSKRSASDPRLRTLGHWDRPEMQEYLQKFMEHVLRMATRRLEHTNTDF